jgi:hypothetical protein
MDSLQELKTKTVTEIVYGISTTPKPKPKRESSVKDLTREFK